MSGDFFSVGVGPAYERLERLSARAEELPPGAREALKEALEAFSASVEELQVAGEELRQQNEELTQAQEVIEAQRGRYRDLFEFAPDGYLVTDPAGIIHEANRAAVDLLGVPKVQLLDKPMVLYVAPGERDRFHSHLDRLTQTSAGGVGEVEWEMRLQPRRGAAFPAALTVAPIRDNLDALSGLRWLVRDVSASKRAAERERLLAEASEGRRAALATNRLLQALIDTMPVGALITDADGKIVNTNAAGRDILGSAVRGSLAHPERRHTTYYPDGSPFPSQDLPLARALREGRTVQNVALFIQRADGQEHALLASAAPVLDETGEIISGIAVFQDITDSKAAQETLTKERDFISAVLETAGALVVVLDRQAQIVRFNRACEALTGYTFAEVEGRRFWELFLLPEEVEPVMAVFSELRAGHFPNTFENYWLTRDGERRLISWSNTALLDGEGVVEYIVGTGIDITDHRRAEEALRKSEQEYRQLIEIAQEGVWVIDADAYTTFVNPRMAEMLGYTVEEMQGRHLFSFMDERGVEIASRNLERRRQGISEQHDFEFLCKDRARIYTSLETTPMFDDEGNYIGGLALVADITERRRAEDALRQARDELEMRVQERTAALEDANLALQGEIAERKQIEAELRSSEERLEQRVRERTRELSTLLEISRNVALTLELEPLLELVLDRLKEIVDYDDATISRLAGEEASTLVHRGEVPSEMMLEQTYSLLDAPFVRDLVMNQETVIIPDVRDDSPLAQDFRRAAGKRFKTLYKGVRAWMAVPLAVKDQVVGLLTLKHSIPDYYGAEKHDLVLAFANQAAVAIENTRLYERAQSLAALEERQRLARDLHDAVSQTLFSASLAAEVLPRLWESNPEEGRRCLTELGQLTRGALAEMRTLLLELRPASLTEVSLEDLLRQLVEAASARARVPMELYLQGECSLTPQVQVTLYRIAQETLSNIVKHANAKRVEIQLRCTPDPAPQVGMVFQDDGRGFELDSVPADGMGLSIMRERAESIGAEINIDSQPGAGTRVEVTWPAG
jgi:PAS domain S-box-containing protein